MAKFQPPFVLTGIDVFNPSDYNQTIDTENYLLESENNWLGDNTFTGGTDFGASVALTGAAVVPAASSATFGVGSSTNIEGAIISPQLEIRSTRPAVEAYSIASGSIDITYTSVDTIPMSIYLAVGAGPPTYNIYLPLTGGSKSVKLFIQRQGGGGGLSMYVRTSGNKLIAMGGTTPADNFFALGTNRSSWVLEWQDPYWYWWGWRSTTNYQ